MCGIIVKLRKVKTVDSRVLRFKTRHTYIRKNNNNVDA